jgi:hypothetical protein
VLEKLRLESESLGKGLHSVGVPAHRKEAFKNRFWALPGKQPVGCRRARQSWNGTVSINSDGQNGRSSLSRPRGQILYLTLVFPELGNCRRRGRLEQSVVCPRGVQTSANKLLHTTYSARSQPLKRQQSPNLWKHFSYGSHDRPFHSLPVPIIRADLVPSTAPISEHRTAPLSE